MNSAKSTLLNVVSQMRMNSKLIELGRKSKERVKLKKMGRLKNQIEQEEIKKGEVKRHVYKFYL